MPMNPYWRRLQAFTSKLIGNESNLGELINKGCYYKKCTTYCAACTFFCATCPSCEEPNSCPSINGLFACLVKSVFHI